MTNDRARRLAQLKQALESGAIDQDTYRAAVAALDKETGTTAHVNGSGAAAQAGGIATGAGGVAVGGDMHGDIYIGVPPPTPGPHRLPQTSEGSGGWNTSAIRDLLAAAFSDQELTTLCFDYFRVVYDDFSSGMSKGDKLQRLLEHCERHDQMARLVSLVRDANPAQYTRFESRLKLSSRS